MTLHFKPLTAVQLASLISLTAYTSGLSFLMHFSRKDAKNQYLVSTSVFLAELLKLIVSCIMEVRRIKASPPRSSSFLAESEGLLEEKDIAMGALPLHHRITRSSVRWEASSSSPPPHMQVIDSIFSNDCWKLGLPALLYLIQNSLQLYGITTVSPGTYQALTQMKILAASFLSVFFLGRWYSRQQWLSIVVLVVGVTMLSSSKIDPVGQQQQQHQLIMNQPSPVPHNFYYSSIGHCWNQRSLGVIAVLAACFFGSGGAVIMEQSVKDGKSSLWVRNAQLSFFSLLPAGFAVLYNAFNAGSWSPMQHFGAWAWYAVIVRAIGGFLISYVLKQCDAIMKGIATSLAMILSLTIECYLLGQGTNVVEVLGATLVFASSIAYVRYNTVQ